MKKIVEVLLLIHFIIAFAYFGSKLVVYSLDMSYSKNLKEDLINEVIDVEIDENTNTKNYKIDFTKLLDINKDTVGWINYNNGKIDYPIVQAQDNDYYLTRAFDKKGNQSGSIFMDYRNQSFADQNVVLFGHSMLNGSMFGNLRDVFKEGFFDNQENNYIKIITSNNENLTYQIFSYYTIESEEYYITTAFKTDADFQKFIDTIKNRSFHNFNIDVNINDKILTLSTCYGMGGTNQRKVIHAKLISS